jgi:hypothetical protein
MNNISCNVEEHQLVIRIPTNLILKAVVLHPEITGAIYPQTLKITNHREFFEELSKEIMNISDKYISCPLTDMLDKAIVNVYFNDSDTIGVVDG